MGLDIRFKKEKAVLCPHCGERVFNQVERELSSGGRGWYPILESLGYYVPYEKRTEENDWYAKDMTLTNAQMKEVCAFLRKHSDLYEAPEIHDMIASAILTDDEIVVNADW